MYSFLVTSKFRALICKVRGVQFSTELEGGWFFGSGFDLRIESGQNVPHLTSRGTSTIGWGPCSMKQGH